jgi:hypothetical protein
MIFDKQTLFSDAQAITASAASTNAIDLGPVDLARDIGKGKPIPLLIQVVEVFDSVADDETLEVAVQFDSTETFTPDKAIVIGKFTNAQLKTLGFQLPCQAIPDGSNLQYMRLYYTVAGSGNFTAGKLTAGIVMGRQTNG